MRDDLFHDTIASALAQLRRAIVHEARTTPARAWRGDAQGELPGGRAARHADPDANRSLTEQHLRVLGVGQPPDRVETEIAGPRW